MTTPRPVHFLVVGSVLLSVAGAFAFSSSAGAETYRTRGKGNNFDLSWIEYDPDDVLGLPGNTHVGYIYASTGQYGDYIGGSVTDFDCEDGESPWGGHHIVEGVIDEAAETTDAAIGDAIDAVVDSGAATIDGEAVVAEVQSQLAEEITDTIQDEFEEIPTCDYIQDRYLQGNASTKLTVDINKQVARMTGRIDVTNGHGGHGGDVSVIATPPVDITITGGEWNKWTNAYSGEGLTWRYSGSEQSRGYSGGVVTGHIGPMGFADDADDEAWGGFSRTKYEYVERIR